MTSPLSNEEPAMLCYKDTTFCPFKLCAKFTECPRAFTDAERKAADEWWGKPGAPICFYADPPGCFEVAHG